MSRMIKHLKWFIFIFISFWTFSCSNVPDYMKYEVVFYTTLGTNTEQVGSNLEELKKIMAYDKTYLIGDYLDLPTSYALYRNRFFIADKYNKWISIFSYGVNVNSNTVILSEGEGYQFDIPFQIKLNKYGEIYLLASVRGDFTTNDYDQYLIYKFNADGKFLFTIGSMGINTKPMPYPDRIEVDLFDNLYVYNRDFDEDLSYWLVKRFSSSGELSFEFNTKYISLSNTIDKNLFVGRISDIFNLKNDERLIIFSEFVLAESDGIKINNPDSFYQSLDVYSILQNKISKNIYHSYKEMDGMLGITYDDEIVLISHDDKAKGVRFRYIPLSSSLNPQEELKEEQKERVYYAPLMSEYDILLSYFIDFNGEIYSTIVKDSKYFALVHWKKKKGGKSGEIQ